MGFEPVKGRVSGDPLTESSCSPADRVVASGASVGLASEWSPDAFERLDAELPDDRSPEPPFWLPAFGARAD